MVGSLDEIEKLRTSSDAVSPALHRAHDLHFPMFPLESPALKSSRRSWREDLYKQFATSLARTWLTVI